MAELPEVETLRRDLDREVVGKRVKTTEVPGKGVVNHHPTKKHFASRLDGMKITGVERRGTLLDLKLDSGEYLVIDIRRGGGLRRATGRDAMTSDTQAVITFTQSGQLRFLDKTGELDLWVTTAEDLADEVPELGLDPVDEPISWTRFARLLVDRQARLRTLLLDPTAVAGIGPLYADEILHSAGLRHDRTSDSLSSQEMRRLYRALVETLHDAVKHRGTSLAGGFTDLSGEPGGYQAMLAVYERAGQACPRCRATVTKVRVRGETIFSCPACQV